MISKKIKIFLIIFFFIAFLFLLIDSVKADCYYFCVQKYGCDCGRGGTAGGPGLGAHSSCAIFDKETGDLWCQWGTMEGYKEECTNANNTRKCKGDACPDEPGWNGKECLVTKDCWSGIGCYGQDCPGKWDASNKWCVHCEGKLKTKRFGSSAGIDVTCGNCEGVDIPDTCETACDPLGVSPECDDTPNGLNVPAKYGSGVCNNCVFVKPCSWQDDKCGQGDCKPTERHQTCGPAGCVGTCDGQPPGSTRCIYDLACDCEATCTCTCPDQCPCSMGGEPPLYKCPSGLEGGLVPCGRGCNDPCTKECECCPCTLCHLFVLFKRIVDFLAKDVLFPLAVLMIVIGGVMFLTAAGDPGRIGTAKRILTSVVIGLLIIFLAWLIVDTIIMFITKSDSPFRNWNEIDCPLPEEAPPSEEKPPSGCTCTDWVNDACGAAGCAATEMHQTRTCPNDCDKESQCVADIACGAHPPAGCLLNPPNCLLCP